MTSAVASRPHWDAVDFIKAIAILAVIAAHSGTGRFGNDGLYNLEFFLTRLWTPFHVPAFLIVSGFLYASVVPVGGAVIGRRLIRVLIPYGIASVAVILTVGSASSISEALTQIATASALSIYYYVLLIVCLIILLWPLSRIPAWGISGLLGLCFLAEVARALWPSVFGSESAFWSMRNIFDHFVLGYFLVGWIGALSLPQLSQKARAHGPWLLVAAVIGLFFFGAVFRGWLPGPANLARIGYTLSVVGAVALLTRARSGSRAVLFLSEASLALYLFHRIFQKLTLPWFLPLPEFVRIGGQFAVGLGGSILLVLIFRRLAGRAWTRRLIGG